MAPARPLPYGRQFIGDDDVAAVAEVLRSDWLTTGPKVAEFEQAFAARVDARHAVAVNSGTAALHAAAFASGVRPGDEVIVPAITFVATANVALYLGARPVFADVDPDTLLIDPDDVARKMTSRTRAVIAVDYAGQAADYAALQQTCGRATIVADACHALGASSGGTRVGSLASLNCFSFHPVKHATTGEGGMVTTDDPDLASSMRAFRNHGITTDQRERAQQGTWAYDMVSLGYNYRLTDFQCALGLSQLRKLPTWVARRQSIAKRYDQAFVGTSVRPLGVRPGVVHAYHLYVVRVPAERRGAAFKALRSQGIGVNVHYRPVYQHPYYQELGYKPGLCPLSEASYDQILSLPMFPQMTDGDVDRVVRAVLAET